MHLLIADDDLAAPDRWNDVVSSSGLQISHCGCWQNVSERLSNSQIAVIDQSVLGDSPVSRVSQLATSFPHVALVVTGASLSVSEVVEVMRLGINYVFEKPLEVSEISNRLAEIVQEASTLQARKSEYDSLMQLFANLTRRERDVLELVLDGTSNKHTAEHLDVSVRTIEARRAKVYAKMQSRSLVELVRKVDRLCWLDAVFNSTTGEHSEQMEAEEALVRPFDRRILLIDAAENSSLCNPHATVRSTAIRGAVDGEKPTG